MDYTALSREQLIRRVTELEMLTHELLREKEAETRLDYSWSGNLGHWYFNIQTNSVVFNPLKIEAMGFTMAELPESVPYGFFTDRLHPDDYAPTMPAMLRHMDGETPVYEVEYRIQCKGGRYRWFYDRGQITQRDADGTPLFAAGIVFDITERKERELHLVQKSEILQQDAETDSLTGIANRRAILGLLEERLGEAVAKQMDLGVIMLDIDHFKRVNDQHGHLVGDRVLRETAQAISSLLRGMDAVGRYGGEEFLVVLPNTSEENAAFVAERIRRLVAEHDFGEGICVTISCGVAGCADCASGVLDSTTLIGLADQNLYQAKRDGRNRVISCELNEETP